MNEIIKRTMVFYVFIIILISANMQYIDELWLKAINLITFIACSKVYWELYQEVTRLKYTKDEDTPEPS